MKNGKLSRPPIYAEPKRQSWLNLKSTRSVPSDKEVFPESTAYAHCQKMRNEQKRAPDINGMRLY